MTVLLVILLVVNLGALGLAGWWFVVRRPESVMERRRRKQWVITLKSGEAFRGVLTLDARPTDRKTPVRRPERGHGSRQAGIESR